MLYIQEEIKDRVLSLLTGAIEELKVGAPNERDTDVGPVIDKEAYVQLNAHIARMKKEATLVACARVPSEKNGYFVAPTAFCIESIKQLQKECFGPILHVIFFKFNELDEVITSINETGFGLTLGIHSRNEMFGQYVARKVNVGNVYINRNQVGAVVGVQPFGGMGLSGTGPKAGGPHYLYRFVVEKHHCINTTAMGGNTKLMGIGDELGQK